MSSLQIQPLQLDPNGFRINCCSFQQDALITAGQYQYVALYVPQPRGGGGGDPTGPRVTCIGRKPVNGADWEFIYFDDYIQTKDDGHNVISMGISGDGIIHLAWDMHGDEIHYRCSVAGLAPARVTTTETAWTVDSFSSVMNYLPSDTTNFTFSEITYPRFQTVDNGDVLLEFRDGRSGLGDCCIYRFCSQSHKWNTVASPYIHGVQNNAYLHGFDYRNGILHVTWTYRDFVEDRVEEATHHTTAQAGPNGPENNHDLHYMYSPDNGISWYNTTGQKLSVPVDVTQDTLAVLIPKYSGIMNQEGQCVDPTGAVHVLGREYGRYYHYYKMASSTKWHKRKINNLEAKVFGARGKLVYLNDTLYGLLPLENHQFVVLGSKKVQGEYDSNETWAVVSQMSNLDGEPLYDRYSERLSFLQREATGDNRRVVLCTLDL
ncbi:hypothetical protein PSN45_000478 [Yamadazyma tenuis]|uniref:Dockerin type 1 n=1 Tax=Candida tenuis (strain ATCC 10573 / BCRC 21748 / CBS 615 / JCM 9827 / NBRC 10315 / NRRL Y-1498 / VKM Y-70) TaxID=590646 RepID=G3B8W6_CANTC|nr:uncharacterized protein CANTEDRAFT_94676 [Yamadazyma tenuis ATCC 10573]EGV61793.1 hypothetical protein CANTEDRAFT_94676 [Yamadazyma tenuis ATCC 10573]WEJ93019.1 hypothetical protein PSN45_000478 [Yamadazyma tenuis]